MDLMVEFPGDRVVPRERFGPVPQLFVGTARGTTHGPLASGAESLTCQSGLRWARKTKPVTGANSPS